MTLILDAPPWTAPAPLAPLSVAVSVSQAALAPVRVYTTARGQTITDAVLDSLDTYQRSTEHAPTRAVVSWRVDTADDARLRDELSYRLGILAIYVDDPIHVDRGTWGLTHSEAHP